MAIKTINRGTSHAVSRFDITAPVNHDTGVAGLSIQIELVVSVYRRTMRDWRMSRRIASVVFGVILVLQFLIPVSRIRSDGPQRFAWQMFSEGSPTPLFVVHTSDAGEIDISLEDYTAMLRADIALTDLVPPHLCAVVPAAVSVTWQTGEFQC